MANIMNLKSLRNKPSRNGFDLSFKKNFTAKAGELLPVMVKEVLPGDVFNIDLSSFTRTQPINTAAFARMREYYDFFFVPYNLLWNKADTVLTQMLDNPQHSTALLPSQNVSLQGTMPYITCAQIANYIGKLYYTSLPSIANNFLGYKRAHLSCKLLEYLGYGNFSSYMTGKSASDTYWKDKPMMSNLQLNVFGLLAYQKIYADFFRDSQWEKISPSTFNVDFLSGATSTNISWDDNFMKSYNMFDLRYCNWQKDLFHGVVPKQQYGDTSVAPVNIPVAGIAGPSAANLNILLLRQAEFLQKWKEIAQSGAAVS